MLAAGKARLSGDALRRLSVKAMNLTLEDAAIHGQVESELSPPDPLPELDTRILRPVAADVLAAYDTYGPVDIAHSWVLGAGLQEAVALARGEQVTDPVVIGICHHYWVRFTMQVLFAARSGNEETIAQAFEPLLSWDQPVV